MIDSDCEVTGAIGCRGTVAARIVTEADANE